MKEIKMGLSVIGNEILAGHVDKQEKIWTEKQDVTNIALFCVAQYCLRKDGVVVLSIDDKPAYEITVKEVKE